MADSVPSVTIVIPNYNYGRFVGEAIASSLAQDYPNLEVLVIDNASTDDSRSVIERFSEDRRLRMVFNDHNIGRNANFDRGAELSSGEYLLFLSADDYYFAGAVSTLVAFLNAHEECDAVYGSIVECDASSRPQRVSRMLGHLDVDHYVSRNSAAALASYTSYMWLPTFLCRKADFVRFGCFNQAYQVGADLALQMRMSFGGVRIGFINEILAAVRFHGENASGAESYGASGLQYREFVRLCNEMLDEEGLIRIRGRERLPLAVLDILASGRVHFPAVGEAVEEMSSSLTELRTRLEGSARAQRSFPPSRARPRPKASVIALVRNGADIGVIRENVRLALASETDTEVAVVSMHASDIAPLFDEFERSGRIQCVRYTGGGGEAGARNAGIRLTDGDVLFFLSDRTSVEPHWIDDAMEALRLGDLDVVWGDFTLSSGPEQAVIAAGDVSLQSLCVAPCILLETFAIRRSSVSGAGEFVEGLGAANEWLFMATHLNSAKHKALPVQSARVRWQADLANSGFGERCSALNDLLNTFYGRVASNNAAALESARKQYVASVNAAMRDVHWGPDSSHIMPLALTLLHRIPVSA